MLALCQWTSFPAVVEHVQIIWNNKPEVWHSSSPCASHFLNLTASSMRLRHDSCSAHVLFAPEDAMDNHYALAGALGLPSAATLLLDDDVPLRGRSGLRAEYVGCMLAALQRSGGMRVVSPVSGMRLLVLRSSRTKELGGGPHEGEAMVGVARTWWAELRRAGLHVLKRAEHGNPLDEGTPFCAALPKVLLVSTALLTYYARRVPPAVRAVVRAFPVCDDVAFAALAHAALRQPGSSPRLSPFVALDAPNAPPEGYGEWGKGVGFASMPNHRAIRDGCWRRVLSAMASADRRWETEQLFLPSQLVASCSDPNLHVEVNITRAGVPYHAERNRSAARAIDPFSCGVIQP